MEWSEVKSSQLKLVAAGIGAGALVAMGTLTVVFSDTPGTVGAGPEVTLGETTTSSVAPSELATTFVTPPVTAERPDGFDVGG
ncbi:MAG: hypothetical protein QOJ20_1498 [Mycobacterium sp.]|jgi:hypothetical protein|nr:hypothetical protein [Mycobacterium sp.]